MCYLILSSHHLESIISLILRIQILRTEETQRLPKATISNCGLFSSKTFFIEHDYFSTFFFPDMTSRLEWPISTASFFYSYSSRCFCTESQNLLMDRKMSAHCYSILLSDKHINTVFPSLIFIQNLFYFWPQYEV